jgi:aspartate carbamoyltransferase regulatory subunit
MSLQPREIEEIIAKRLGEVNNGNGFTVDELEPFIAKMKAFDLEKKQQAEKKTQEYLAKKKKAQLVCRNAQCRNDREEDFEKDERVAQITCKICGTVLSERQVYDGEWVRQFDGEINPSFHGPPPDLKFSSGHGLQTGFAEIPGAKKKQAKDLALAQKSVELNLSSMMDPKKERATRIGYKDNDKQKVFDIMQEVSESIQLHGTILERAETIFARYRDDTEQLAKRFEIAAACLILSFREKLREEGEAFVLENNSATPSSSSSSNRDEAKPSEPVLEFKCKYCQFPFSLKRDRTFHQKQCEERPKIDAPGDHGNGAKDSADGGSGKRMRPS